VIQRHYKNPHAFIFIALLVYFLFTIPKQQKHSNNKNHKNIL